MAQPTAYQAVDAAGVYDPTGKPHYLTFDGVDDFYTTGNIDFTGTDKVTVVVGSTVTSPSTAMMLEFGSSSSSLGSFYIANVGPTIREISAVPTSGDQQKQSYIPSSSESVISARLNFAGATQKDRVRTRIDGVYKDSLRAGGVLMTGSFGNLALNIGARTGSSLFTAGKYSALIIRGAATSDADLLKLEQGTAKLQGRTL